MKPSECGKFVVVILKSGKTIVIQLPAEALLDETLSSGKIHMPSSSQPSPISSLESRGTTGISTFGISKGQVISNRSCIIRHTQGSSGHMVSFKSGDRPSIQLTNHTGSNVRSLELLSLPLTQNIGQTTSTALMPQSEDEPLRVIVNSNSRTNYSMNEIDDNPFPALIERKIELITPQEMNGNDKQRAQLYNTSTLYPSLKATFKLTRSTVELFEVCTRDQIKVLSHYCLALPQMLLRQVGLFHHYGRHYQT